MSKDNRLHTGKEFDSMHGLNLYDNQARLYDPVYGNFTGLDPLADHPKQIAWSPYAHCLNNPIRYMDPTGLLVDDYKLSQNGEISMIEKTNDNFDMLYASNEDGSIQKDNSVQVEKGILDTVKKGKDHNGTDFDYMKVNNNQIATQIFEFASKNSKVEWSQIKYGTKSNYLSTSHQSNTEKGGAFLIYKLLLQNYTIKEHIHSHPDRITNNPGPSGFHPNDKNKGDRLFGEWINRYYPNKNIQLKVYEVPLNRYINYNHKEVKDMRYTLPHKY